MIDLFISIINTNNREMLKKCISKIYENTKNITFLVAVLDNNSKDGSVEMVRKNFPEVWLSERKDLGAFPENHNINLKKGYRKARNYLLLNDDIFIKDRAFDILVEFMNKHPEVWVCGPRVYTPEGGNQNSGSKNIDPWHAFLMILGKLDLDKMNSNLNPDKTTEVMVIGGGCFFIRDKALDEIGFLDESIMVYKEEHDYCRRIKKAGGKVFYVAESKVTHFHATTLKKMPEIVEYRSYLSSVHFFKKYYPAYWCFLLVGTYKLTFMVRIFQALIICLIRPSKRSKLLNIICLKGRLLIAPWKDPRGNFLLNKKK